MAKVEPLMAAGELSLKKAQVKETQRKDKQ